MRRSSLLFAIVLALAACLPAGASDSADAAHLRVQLVFPQTQLAAGASIRAGLYFKLEPGWHVYWQNAGDSGEPPHMHWTLPAGVTAGPLQFPAPQRLPLGPLMDFGYENEVLFPFSLDVAGTAKPGPAVLHAKVDWLVCRDVCIPGKAELDEGVQIVRGATAAQPNPAALALLNRFQGELPRPLPAGDKAVFQPTAVGFRLAVETGQRETQAEFFPADQDVLDNPAPQKLTPTSAGVILDLKKGASLSTNPAALKGVIELSAGRAYTVSAVPGTVAAPAVPPASTTDSLARIVALAFLGGLLLNLMPCVFPVLFLKGLALVRSGSHERQQLRAHGMVYAAGILVSFWILVAALLGLRATGATLGWGFQFQSPVFLFLLDAVFFFLGLALAGQFEIGLSLTGAGQSLASKQGYAGSFFTGVLAVVVATPCTAPFMGAAIGYALASPAGTTFAVFTALGIGLAAPYLAFTIQPAWTRFLPRPGAWMEVFRQAISIPIFGTAIWLTLVLATAYGAVPLAALLVSFLLLAVAGWFLGRWPGKRWSAGVAVALWLCVAGLAVSNQRLAAGAGIDAAGGLAGATGSAGTQAGGATWQPWSAAAVETSLAGGRPVFVDFTASWCLSCQVNERVALSQPEVMRAFAARNVVLLKADWTRQNPTITEALAGLGRSGVPVYALYTPGQSTPQLLPQVLTPGIVRGAIEKISEAGTEGQEGH